MIFSVNETCYKLSVNKNIMDDFILYKGQYALTDKGLKLGQSDVIYDYYVYDGISSYLHDSIKYCFIVNNTPYKIVVDKKAFIVNGDTMIITQNYTFVDFLKITIAIRNAKKLVFDMIMIKENQIFFKYITRKTSCVIFYGCGSVITIILSRYMTHVTIRETVKSVVLTSNIQHLTFGDGYNNFTILTPNITCLTFGQRFNQPIILTHHIKILTFGENFNQPIVLTPYITHLTFGYYYQTPILTSRITHLTLWNSVSKPIILTSNITFLSIGARYDMKIDSCDYTIVDNIPNCTTHVTLEKSFNLPLTNIPCSVKKLM